MTRRRALIAGWLVALALSATLPLSALLHGVFHAGTGKLVFDQPLSRPLISLGSDVYLQRGSRSIVLAFAGNIYLQRTALDDLVTVNGDVYLTPHSTVTGDVLALSGGIFRAPGAHTPGRLGGALHDWDGHSARSSHSLQATVGNNVRLGLAAGLALLLVGICVTVVFPWQIVLIATTIRSAPAKSALAGIMNLMIFVFLVVPLGLSLAGLPFAILLTAAASLAWLFGLTAAAVILGRILSRTHASLLWATGAGLVVIAMVMAVPLVGPMMITAIGLMGAGALAVALLDRARPSSPML